MTLKRLSLFVVLLLSQIPMHGQDSQTTVNIQLLNEAKEVYAIGDTVLYKITVKISSEICMDGMDRAKIYLSGYSKVSEEEWHNIRPEVWEKKLTLLVVNNKKNESKITLLRKADKGEFFMQKKIKTL